MLASDPLISMSLLPKIVPSRLELQVESCTPHWHPQAQPSPQLGEIDSIDASPLDPEASDSDVVSVVSSVVEEIEVTLQPSRSPHAASPKLEPCTQAAAHLISMPPTYIGGPSPSPECDENQLETDDYSSELDLAAHFQLSARDHSPFESQSQLQPLRQLEQRMTPQLARQKACDLSYEIGALKKIQERLERQRERMLMYCMNGGKSID